MWIKQRKQGFEKKDQDNLNKSIDRMNEENRLTNLTNNSNLESRFDNKFDTSKVIYYIIKKTCYYDRVKKKNLMTKK